MGEDAPVKQAHRPVDERREQLLDAAVAVMLQRGMAGATTRAITERAGVPHGVFHYCFGSKQELFAALFEREISKTLASADEAMRACDDVGAALRAALDAQLQLVRAEPAYHLALDELSLANQRVEALVELGVWEQREYRRRTREDLQRWSEGRGVTWSVPIDDLAAHLVAVGRGISSTWLADRDDDAARAAVDVAARAVGALALGPSGAPAGGPAAGSVGGDVADR